MPSASSLLRASSRAHVCILQCDQIVSSHILHSNVRRPYRVSMELALQCSNRRKAPDPEEGLTYDVSGLKTYATPAATKLPMNP